MKTIYTYIITNFYEYSTSNDFKVIIARISGFLIKYLVSEPRIIINCGTPGLYMPYLCIS